MGTIEDHAARSQRSSIEAQDAAIKTHHERGAAGQAGVSYNDAYRQAYAAQMQQHGMAHVAHAQAHHEGMKAEGRTARGEQSREVAGKTEGGRFK